MSVQTATPSKPSLRVGTQVRVSSHFVKVLVARFSNGECHYREIFI